MPLNNLGLVDQLPNGNILFRSAQPSESDVPMLNLLRIKTIVKLDDEAEQDELEWGRNVGQVFMFSVPPRTFSTAILSHIETFVRQRLDAGNVLVHCLHGRDRSGVVIGAYRMIENHWTLDQAVAEMKTYAPWWLNDLVAFEGERMLQGIQSALGAAR